MGADLIISFVIMRGKDSIVQRRKKMIKAVDKISRDELKNDVEFWSEEFGKVIKNVVELKKLYRKVIVDFTDCLENRDVTRINYRGEVLLITGGMSWGDDPTESYPIFNRFYSINDKIKQIGGFE